MSALDHDDTTEALAVARDGVAGLFAHLKDVPGMAGCVISLGRVAKAIDMLEREITRLRETVETQTGAYIYAVEEVRKARELQETADAAQKELSRLTTLRPASEWHEDIGVAVLWWPIDDRDGLPHEAPYCGSLLEVEPPFPFEFGDETGEMHGAYVGQHLYWTPLPRVRPVKP